MDVKLVIEKGSSETKAIRLRSVETIIGRQNDCEVRIPSEAVSRRHCRLSFHEDILTVEDLDSANGTSVNGEQIERPRVLRPGDRLEVGPVTFVIKYQLTPAALDRLLREEAAQDSADVDVEPVDDIPEMEVEELDTHDSTAEMDVDAEQPSAKAKPQGAKKTPVKPAAKSPPRKPAKPLKKKPAEKTRQADQDDGVDPDVAAMLDGETSWHMPSNDDFRDFLTHMDDDK